MAASAANTVVRVSLFGPFGVCVNGVDVEPTVWPGRRSAELVQLLTLTDGHCLPRDRVIDALWPRLDAAAGGANLRKAAHHARRALNDPESVLLKRGRVELFPGARLTSDLADFERAAGDALASGDADKASAVLKSLRGELLPDARYEDWAQPARERFRSLAVRLARETEDWERLVDLDPGDEPAYVELMSRELEAGRRAAAIRWYGRLRAALRRESGLRPSAQAQSVYDECVAGTGQSDDQLFGRQLEIAQAQSLLIAEPGSPRALVVRGSAGLGKSALCREVARMAADRSWTVIETTALGSGAPYAPIAEALERSGAAAGTHGGPGREILERLSRDADPSAKPLSRHQVIGAFRRFLLEAAAEGRTLLVVDDAHLADAATIDVICHLGSAVADPILVLLAYRAEAAQEGLERGVARLARAGRALEIDLAPLDTADSAALVSHVSPTRSPEVVERIVSMADGNPFLTLELAHSPTAGVPALVSTAGDAIASRFVDLDRKTAAKLSRLALANADLDAAVASALLGGSDDETLAILDEAMTQGILVVTEAKYRFRHDLVREALADRMPLHQRVAAHQEIAACLAQAGGPPSLIAHHFAEGERPREAVPWFLRAGRQALRLGAYADAIHHLERLLAHEPRNAEALALRAEALDARGERTAPDAYAEAARAAEGPEADDLLAKRGLALVKLGDPPAGLAGLDDLAPTTLDGQIAHALAFAGAAALGYGDVSIGSEKAAAARRLAFDSGDPEAVAVASWANAAAAHARGELRASVENDLRETGALSKLAVSVFDGQLCITQRMLYGARPYPEVIEFADAFSREASRLGAARGVAFGVTIRGEARLLAGDLERADHDLAEGARLHRRIGAATGEAFATQRRAEVALRRGRRSEALGLLDEALALARESSVGFHLLDRIYGTLIEAAESPVAALAALEEAEDAVRGPVETCPGCRITLAVPAAIAAARGGDRTRAAEWGAQAEYLADVVMRLPAWDAALQEVRGHRALMEGRTEEARERFRAAALGFGGAGQRFDQERCEALQCG